MSLSYCCHDHVVLLLENEVLESLPSWLSSNFKVIEGGTHAGGSSKNKLIIFGDGTYIELFTWINHDNPIQTAWVDKSPGLIAFALTTLRPFTATVNYDHLTRRLVHEEGDGGLGVKFNPPNPGARKRKDGVEVKWEMTGPEYSNAAETPATSFFPTSRLDTPFFAHDVTARVVRVPFDDDSAIAHPCKATGIASVDVLVPPEKLTAYSTLYSNITGVAPDQITADSSREKGVSYKLTTPTSQGAGPLIRIRVPTTEEDEAWLRTRGIGIRAIKLAVDGRKGHGEERLAQEGVGSTISLVW